MVAILGYATYQDKTNNPQTVESAGQGLVQEEE